MNLYEFTQAILGQYSQGGNVPTTVTQWLSYDTYKNREGSVADNAATTQDGSLESRRV